MKIATLCYVKRNGQTLMILRNSGMHKGTYNGLGGKCEPGERPEECVRRELWEEAGIRLRAVVLKGVITFPPFLVKETGEKDAWYVFVYECYDFEGEPVEESKEGTLHWIENEKVLSLSLPMHKGDKLFLEWMENDKIFSAKLIYNEGGVELLDHKVDFY